MKHARWYVLALLLVACGGSSDDTSATTGVGGAGTGGAGGGGGGGGGAGPPLPSYCFSGSLDVLPTTSGFSATTTHYQLNAATNQQSAEEMARLLEASYGAFADYFAAEPPLAPSEQMEVRFYADYDAWVAGLMADGVTPPSGAAGYYDGSGGVAYLYDQPTRYYTHELLVHEAAHQYHHMARSGVTAQPAWYVEGIAEYLQRHDWDGACTRLGVIPLLTQEDDPAQALSDINGQGIDLTGIVSGSVVTTRPIMWSLAHYLENGDGGMWRAGFKELRDAMDSGTSDVLGTFTSTIAPPSALEPTLTTWLASGQEPMSIVFLEWTHVGPTEVIGDSAFFSVATLKDTTSRFEARFEIPANQPWAAGVLLGFDTANDFTGLVVDSIGRLSTFEMVGGSATWFDRGAAPAASGNGYQLSVEYPSANMAEVTINGQTASYPTALPARTGLAVNGSRVSFDSISWQAP